MKIGIDARMYGLKHAGIGRYVENLVKNLLVVDKSNEYVLLIRKADVEKCTMDSVKCKIVVAEARHYSVKEQLLFPYILEKEKLDLVHFPHFNIPLFYPGKFVVTIHDLLWHETKGRDVTTLPSYLYGIKYAGYRLVFANAVKRAQKLFVPSKWVKKKLISKYNIHSDKVIVTYEGVDGKYIESRGLKVDGREVLEKYGVTKPFFIYTGSAYPHKNLSRLLDAVKKVSRNKIQLAIVSTRDVFWEKLEGEVREKDLRNEVKLLGFVPDADLKVLYQEALAFVFPSLSEGFGLPGLEAMASGCPVVSSNAGSLPEVYADAAVYFDPSSVDDITKNLQLIMNNEQLRNDLRKKGLEQAKKYSWKKMARETLIVYEQCLKEKNK